MAEGRADRTSGARKRVGIRDVAQAANVSTTTVSHALNGKGRVDLETRERIARIARDLGYEPNRTAQTLRSGRTQTLALLLPIDIERHEVARHFLDVDFYLEVLVTGVSQALECDYGLLALPPPRTPADLKRFAIDGAIVVSARAHDVRIDLLESVGLPYVSVDRDPARADNDWWVAPDNTANTFRVLDHLADQGAERIALVSLDIDWSWFADTNRAYRAWAESRGRESLVTMVARLPERPGVDGRIEQLLKGPHPPDAVYAPPQWIATQVLTAARSAGLRVPADLRLAVGVDSGQARMADPPLTAVDLDPAGLAERAVRLLIERIEGADPPPPELLTSRLATRRSTLVG